MYFQCVVFSKDRKLPTDLLLKGKEVFVKGSLRPNNYTNMKSTEHFKKTILAYLDKRALEDKLFAVAHQKPGKNEEIYSMAVHYYDEDNIKAGQRPDCQVIVNHTVELTEKGKAEARQRAVLQYQEAERKKLENRHKKAAAKKETDVHPSHSISRLRSVKNTKAHQMKPDYLMQKRSRFFSPHFSHYARLHFVAAYFVPLHSAYFSATHLLL